MRKVFVLAEHRRGEIRDITFDLLSKGRHIAEKNGADLEAIALGYDMESFSATLAKYADRVLVIEDNALRDFNSDAYQTVLSQLISEHEPLMTLIGHTAFGLDLAPSLSAKLSAALVTDCVEIDVIGDNATAVRPAYGGKVRASVVFRKATHRIATVQSGSATNAQQLMKSGEIIRLSSPLTGPIPYKRFLEYLDSSAGEVDISQAEIVVSVGRGIGEPKNIQLVENLTNALGGLLACSRPVVDKKWLPKARQVGISGKTVQPKLYLAIGISGAFQHISAIKGTGLIVAVNKDPNAPIFRIADYSIVGDLFTVVPSLTEKIVKAKSGK
ncbi:MAG: electron transfer flavoprotein subunit alpha/FixB family protein [Candidatus Marsarchaeota archaeon]|nr:electron transfer flavoprotein subunit alpha/FixB family protein [Candidatus Marsarchaeota archaeon]